MYKDVGPKEVQVGAKLVRSVGKCSCGTFLKYEYHEAKFRNYCPYCKKEGTLIYEQGPTCPEGMWVCRECDADFCLVSGKEHIQGSQAHLTKA
ncbi:hypothetical protein [Methanobrevibacter filiformis]|uniref:hypothetical protein n=1 Tax=Methanobrevibacter filiformis TaxID=55758 RepID=UPI0012EEDA1F|nr:hypothetical protein [Methanobrevibacter filiformis]